MKIFFRVDFSNKIGFGHIKRCLSIIEQNNFLGYEFIFISRKYYKELPKGLEKIKFFFINKNLSYKNETVIIKNLLTHNDKIIFDICNSQFIKSKEKKNYFKNIFLFNKNIIIIDGIGQTSLYKYISKYSCTYYSPYYSKKKIKKSKNIKYFLGPKYFIFNKEFIKKKKKIFLKKHPKNILLCFGGSDSSKLTYKIASILNEDLFRPYNFNIVLGPLISKKQKNKLNNFKKYSKLNITIYDNPKNFLNLLTKTDIAIVSNGHLKYEVFYLQIPSIIIPVNKNFEIFDRELKNLNLSIFLKYLDLKNTKRFNNLLYKLLNVSNLRYKMFTECKSFFHHHDENLALKLVK